MKRLAQGAMLLVVLGIGGCATVPSAHVTAPAWVATSTASKQQIWGVYDRLAGTTWSAPDAYVLFYRWAVPDQVLVEEFRHPATGELNGTNIIVPGTAPGTLVLTSSVANLQWQGTLDSQGNALFVRDGVPRMPMRVSLAPSGEIRQEKVTLDGDRVVSIDSSTTYTPLGQQGVASLPATAPAPASTRANTAPAIAPARTALAASPASQAGKNWGVFDRIAGKTWLSEGSGGRAAHAFLLRLEKTEDGHLITAYTGNSHRLAKSIDYRLAPSGAISASGNTVIGPKENMPVSIGADGELIRFNSASDRSTYQLDTAGYLVVKHETKGWGDTWDVESTVRLRDISMGPEWGPFARLAGFAWVNKVHVYPTVYYEFSYPEKNLIQVWIGPDNVQHWGDDVALLKDGTLIGHTESRIKNSYLLEPGSSTYSVDSPSSMTRRITDNRKDVYSVLDENTVSISQQELKDGTWQSIKEVKLSREQESEKDERLKMWAAHEKARQDSESSTRFLNDMAALNGALTSANAIAAQRTAQSRASLDRTLDALARQAAQPPVSAQAEQDATVAAAMAQARQIAREAGDESVIDRTIADTNRAIDQREQAARQAPAPGSQGAPAQAKATATDGEASYSYMGCVVDEFPVKKTYISDIARIHHYGDQQRWNEEFFRRHVAQTYDRDLSKLHAHCHLDRENQAGVERQLDGVRKVQTRNGIPIVEVEWSPSKQF